MLENLGDFMTIRGVFNNFFLCNEENFVGAIIGKLIRHEQTRLSRSGRKYILWISGKESIVVKVRIPETKRRIAPFVSIKLDIYTIENSSRTDRSKPDYST